MPLGKLENNLMRKINFLRTVFYASLFVLVSCKDDQISYYQAPKDAPPKMPPPAQHSGSTSDAEPQGTFIKLLITLKYPKIGLQLLQDSSQKINGPLVKKVKLSNFL